MGAGAVCLADSVHSGIEIRGGRVVEGPQCITATESIVTASSKQQVMCSCMHSLAN